jgi:hypothetical protein
MIINPTLPDGWTSEDRGHETVIRCPGTGYVTINWERRQFFLGIGTCHHKSDGPRYAGRGWKQRLLDGAVTKLQSIGARP